MGVRLAAGVLAALPLAGCGLVGGDDDREPTPAEAFAALSRTSNEILRGTTGPAAEITESPRPERGVPCGGLGGSEWSRITYTYSAGAGAVADPQETLAQAVAAMEALDVDHDGVSPGGPSVPSVSFRGPGFAGSLFVHERGTLQISATTDCLRNTDHEARASPKS